MENQKVVSIEVVENTAIGDKEIKKQITALKQKIKNLKQFLASTDPLIINSEEKLEELLLPEKEEKKD